MIKSITNFNEIITTWKSLIESQCELNNYQVRSMTSPHGQILDKRIEDYIYETLSRTDIVALFEINIDSSKSNMSADYEDDKILSYNYYNLKIVFYGESSHLLALSLKSRVESIEIRDFLWNLGINFDEVSSIEQFNEFINHTIYFRTDVNIKFSCRYDISKINTNQDFNDTQQSITDVITK